MEQQPHSEFFENDGTLSLDGHKVRSLREQKQLTQLYLATVVGVTTDTISRWENKRYPTVKRENVLKLAEALEVELDALIERKPKKEADPVGPIRSSDSSTIAKVKRSLSLKVYGPLCLGLFILLSLFGIWSYLGGTKTATYSAIRYLPSHVTPGRTFPVLIHIESDQPQSTTLMLRETLPANCTPVTAIPPYIAQDEQAHRIKWIYNMNNEQQTAVLYLVQVEPGSVPGEQLYFDGNLIIGGRGGQEPTVFGARETEITTFHWADVNRDNRIDDYEILSVYDLLANFDDLEMDLEKIEEIWGGRGYHWNNEKGIIEVLGSALKGEVSDD